MVNTELMMREYSICLIPSGISIVKCFKSCNFIMVVGVMGHEHHFLVELQSSINILLESFSYKYVVSFIKQVNTFFKQTYV